MENNDPLRHLLAEFFDLPPGTRIEEFTQDRVPAWDSLAMVQLIAELQAAFRIEFALEEIENLRSYEEIRHALSRKGVTL